MSSTVGIRLTSQRGSAVPRAARLRLVVLLPMTVAVLVASTGYFTLDMASRDYMIHGFGPAIDHALAGLELQIAAMTVAAGILGLGLGLGVTTPLKGASERRGPVAAGGVRAPVDETPPSEVPLTAGVAHELRNPLASLQGLAELLGRDFSGDDPRRRYVTTMLDSIGRLNGLVEDLLALSAPGAPAEEPFDLNQLLRETVSLARLGLGEKAVAIECRVGTQPLLVVGSAARFGQALTNIVLNAVQATPAGGAITVTAETAGSLATVRVHNTGSYVAPEQVGKLFVPFYTTKVRGTGLGLAIARQIVAAHGGRIGVESHRETGTTFVVELPAAPGDVSETAKSRVMSSES